MGTVTALPHDTNTWRCHRQCDVSAPARLDPLIDLRRLKTYLLPTFLEVLDAS